MNINWLRLLLNAAHVFFDCGVGGIKTVAVLFGGRIFEVPKLFFWTIPLSSVFLCLKKDICLYISLIMFVVIISQNFKNMAVNGRKGACNQAIGALESALEVCT